jgi:hypothetical protein
MLAGYRQAAMHRYSHSQPLIQQGVQVCAACEIAQADISMASCRLLLVLKPPLPLSPGVYAKVSGTWLLKNAPNGPAAAAYLLLLARHLNTQLGRYVESESRAPNSSTSWFG